MTASLYPRSICWFRRDLRLHDHAALYHALAQSTEVHCVFVFDSGILDKLPKPQDRRVEFIWHSLNQLSQALQNHGSVLRVLHGSPQHLIPELARKLDVQAVFCNHDYEPEAITRDAAVSSALAETGVAFHHYKDQVIFEQSEILTGSGQPFSVFTPYKNAWLKKLNDNCPTPYPAEDHLYALAQHSTSLPLPSLASLGFEAGVLNTAVMPAGEAGAAILLQDFLSRIGQYRDARDFPAVKGVSYLSVHLRFGTVSIRRLVSLAIQADNAGAQTWLGELIWREFYQMLLYHHPRLASGESYKPKFNALVFDNDSSKFAAWCEGRTGYPLIDAAMRQLNQTGYMHNRLRMITASFLVKDLHIDWRWGERYFAEHLLDFDLSANNGGWQWAASTGCDAQPWFRIFNPITQSEKFDARGKFIRRYLPELASCPEQWIHAPWHMPLEVQQQYGIVVGRHYPSPIVEHAAVRAKTLERYQAV